MPDLRIPGRLAKCNLSADNGATFENLGGIVDIGMNLNVDELETTTHDDNGARTYLPNHHDATFDVSARWQDGDPGQEILMVSVFAKTVLQFQFFMEIASGRKRFDGSCFATSASPQGPLDDTGGLDVTLRGSGVQMTTQA